MKKISFIFGTRPEAIKLSPLILAMNCCPKLQPHVCVTGQHREMLHQILDVFEVVPDVDMALMQPHQTLNELASRAIGAIDEYLVKHKPDMVVVQGDTTTVFCAAFCAFHHEIPVGHVEAGLRTWNKHSPFPEEINRVLATRLSDLHFAPTKTSRNNLLLEGIDPEKIFVTGNTVIDALYIAIEKIKRKPPEILGLPATIMNNEKPMVLITGHRRENFGSGFISICEAVSDLSKKFSNTEFVYPVHLNPNVKLPVHNMLDNMPNIHLIETLDYFQFVALMNRATIILTDSGGVQEEAPSLGKPVLVMRNTTERPEAVDAGTVKLVGTDYLTIVDNVSILLENEDTYEKMSQAINPYGDGKACERIIEVLMNWCRRCF
jgi:UDP-N-acetylglucosamine 2-epimerase (non-hydrolysing)